MKPAILYNIGIKDQNVLQTQVASVPLHSPSSSQTLSSCPERVNPGKHMYVASEPNVVPLIITIPLAGDSRRSHWTAARGVTMRTTAQFPTLTERLKTRPESVGLTSPDFNANEIESRLAAVGGRVPKLHTSGLYKSIGNLSQLTARGCCG